MRREKLQQLGHLSAGIITLIYGFDSFEGGDFSSATFYLAMAIAFLVVAGSHKWIAEKFLHADIAFYLAEAATIAYSGWRYKLKGHTYLFYTLSIASGIYLIFAVLSLYAEAGTGRRSRRRKRRHHSSSSGRHHSSQTPRHLN